MSSREFHQLVDRLLGIYISSAEVKRILRARKKDVSEDILSLLGLYMYGAYLYERSPEKLGRLRPAEEVSKGIANALRTNPKRISRLMIALERICSDDGAKEEAK